MLYWFSWEHWSFLKTVLVNEMKKLHLTIKGKALMTFHKSVFKLLGHFLQEKQSIKITEIPLLLLEGGAIRKHEDAAGSCRCRPASPVMSHARGGTQVITMSLLFAEKTLKFLPGDTICCFLQTTLSFAFTGPCL